ncbi:MAG: YceI family protein [Bryobacteraceae bacterium]|jgi:polyisoprenoid-binding protein YceI
MNNLIPLFLSALPLFLATHALAQQQSFKIDPQSSEVAFSLSDVLHSVHGVFHVQSGVVDFDPGVSKISGSVVVAAGSGNSGNETRDKKMSKDILDVPHFADILFVPRSYQGTIAASGDATIQVTGTFTLHGLSHELTVPTQIHMDGTICTAKAHFAVPYVKWGLKDPSTFILRVGKEVEIDLTLTGRVSPAT